MRIQFSPWLAGGALLVGVAVPACSSTTTDAPNYSTFVSKTVAKLRPQGKLVTAAVAQYLQGSMTPSFSDN